jgi:hypothetical protein
MLTGTMLRTSSYTFLIYWKPLGSNTDLNMGGRLGRWVNQNERSIDKQRIAMDAIKLLVEQFPSLSLVEARHSNGLIARWEE